MPPFLMDQHSHSPTGTGRGMGVKGDPSTGQGTVAKPNVPTKHTQFNWGKSGAEGTAL